MLFCYNGTDQSLQFINQRESRYKPLNVVYFFVLLPYLRNCTDGTDVTCLNLDK